MIQGSRDDWRNGYDNQGIGDSMNASIGCPEGLPGLSRRAEWIRCGCFLILAGFIVSLWLQQPYFEDPWLVQNDARIHLWWMQKFRDPGLFTDDALAELMEVKAWRSPGFLALFRIAAPAADPLTVSRILSVVMLPVTLLMIFLAGWAIAGSPAGLVAAALYLGQTMQSWDHGIVVMDGLQRSFRDPLLMTGLYGIAANKRKTWLASILLSLLFYPVAAPMILGIVFFRWIVFGNNENVRSRNRKRIAVLVVLLICLAGVSGIAVYYLDKPFYGHTGSIFTNPRFSVSGREPIFLQTGKMLGIPDYFFVGKSGGFLGMHADEAINLFLLLWITLCLIPGARARTPHPVIVSFLLSGCALFLASWVIGIVSGRFLFYFPSRYNALSLFLILWTGTLVCQRRKSSIGIRFLWLSGIIAPALYFHGSGRSMMSASFLIYAVAGLLPDGKIRTGGVYPFLFIGAFMLPLVVDARKAPGAVAPEPWEKQLIETLRQKDKSVVIAGPPDLMNNIPIHARRAVYLSFEMDTEMREDWARERFMKFFDAYYADDSEKICRFADEEHVDLMLVDSRMFSRDFIDSCATGVKRIYLEPHNRWIMERIRDRNRFVLAFPPEDGIEFRYGPLMLVDLRKACNR